MASRELIMVYKKLLAGSVLVLLGFMAHAHEFWLEPIEFFYQKGEKAVISFKVGENFVGEPWDIKKHRVEKLQIVHLASAKDLKTSVGDGPKNNLEIALLDEGTHMVVMQSNNAFIELDADKFNAYLKEDGLDDITFLREKAGTTNKPSKEFYSRHAKLLLQVGSKPDDTYNKPVGLPIEIIPEMNPYSLKIGETIRFKILWQGRPLFGALVKVWNKHNNIAMLQNIYSGKDGVVETTISNSGQWMVSVVKMVPSKTEGADWQSYWGSLVFGVK